MSRFHAWPLIIITLGSTTCVAACNLLTNVSDLNVDAQEPPVSPAVPTIGDGGTPTANDDATTTGDGSIPHFTPPFDASGFPTFDASIPDAAPDDAAPTNTFFDDFQRADGDPLGNGWVERQPTAFNLTTGTVIKTTTVTRYRDNIVYRPSSEDLLDVETTIELRVTASPADGNPQLWARAQSIGPNVVDGYHIYLDNGREHFHLARHRGAISTEIAAFDTPNDLSVGQTYRLLLRVTGTSPVAVYSRLEIKTTSGWSMRGETGSLDNNSDRIQTAGSVGFSGGEEGLFTFDNFSRVGL